MLDLDCKSVRVLPHFASNHVWDGTLHVEGKKQCSFLAMVPIELESLVRENSYSAD